MIKQFNLANASSLVPGTLITTVNRLAFWTIRKKTKLRWVRFTAVRFVSATSAYVPASVELVVQINAASDGVFNSAPPGYNNSTSDLAPKGSRFRFVTQNDGIFLDTPVLPEGVLLDYIFSLYDYGTPAGADSYTWEMSIGYEELE